MIDYEDFKREIYALTGINLSCYKEKQMKRRIDSLIKKNDINTYDDYVKAIKNNRNLFNEFINYLTINVSEFYRNPEQWQVLENEILPVLLKRTGMLRIWSSACSTGDEPYTLVMVLDRLAALSGIKILATDIDRAAIEKAKTGVYSEKSLENLPTVYLQKHFTKSGDTYRIKDEVKKYVEFRQMNLLKDDFPKEYDLIVCRNVLIYFTDEAKNDIYRKFNQSLKAKGVLFLGSTEQIILPNKFNFKPVKTFFYIKEENG